jgi:hypothetical protein
LFAIDPPQIRLVSDKGLLRFRVGDWIYTRQPNGNWSYGDTGVQVLGGRDLLLSEAYKPGSIRNSADELEAVMIEAEDADAHPDLAWAAKEGRLMTDLSRVPAYVVSSHAWSERGSTLCGIFAPEIHGDFDTRVLARAGRAHRIAEHGARLTSLARDGAIAKAVGAEMGSTEIGVLVGLSPGRITQIASDNPLGVPMFDYDDEAHSVLEAVARTPHIEIGELESDSAETGSNVRGAVQRLIGMGLVTPARTPDSLVLTESGRAYIAAANKPKPRS